MSTTNDRQDDEIPHWARLCDGEQALEGIDHAIRDLKKAYEYALDSAMRKAWLGCEFDNGSVIHVITTLRQSLGVAALIKERTEKLIARLKNGG